MSDSLSPDVRSTCVARWHTQSMKPAMPHSGRRPYKITLISRCFVSATAVSACPTQQASLGIRLAGDGRVRVIGLGRGRRFDRHQRQVIHVHLGLRFLFLPLLPLLFLRQAQLLAAALEFLRALRLFGRLVLTGETSNGDSRI